MVKRITEEEFWITNITDSYVSLGELNYYLAPRKSVNLLNKKHFNYTKEELEKSATSGTLKKRENKIKIRKVSPPPPLVLPGNYLSQQPLLIAKLRSRVVLEDPHYEELIESEEELVDKMIED